MNEKLQPFSVKNTFFILDFDFTVTTGESVSSFSLFRRSGLFPREYTDKIQEIYEYYHPFEIDHTLTQHERGEYMKQWHQISFDLLREYGLTLETFDKILKTHTLMKPRDGIKEFLQFTNDHKIPVIIFSAGVKQIIKRFLKDNNLLFDNMYIQANTMVFLDNGKFSTIEEKKFIYPTEKNWKKISPDVQKICDVPYCILIGDMIDDITMFPPADNDQNHFSVGFYNHTFHDSKKAYESIFDIVIENCITDGGVFDMLKKALLENN